jgi:hypothetical protein
MVSANGFDTAFIFCPRRFFLPPLEAELIYNNVKVYFKLFIYYNIYESSFDLQGKISALAEEKI